MEDGVLDGRVRPQRVLAGHDRRAAEDRQEDLFYPEFFVICWQMLARFRLYRHRSTLGQAQAEKIDDIT